AAEYRKRSGHAGDADTHAVIVLRFRPESLEAKIARLIGGSRPTGNGLAEAVRSSGDHLALLGTNGVKVGSAGRVGRRQLGGKLEPWRLIWAKHHVARQIACAQAEVPVVERGRRVIGFVPQSTHGDGRGDEIEQSQAHGETALERSKPRPHGSFFSTNK